MIDTIVGWFLPDRIKDEIKKWRTGGRPGPPRLSPSDMRYIRLVLCALCVAAGMAIGAAIMFFMRPPP